MTTSPAVRRLWSLLYLAGALVMADQLADLGATLLANPPTPGLPSWRFGAFGLVVSRASVFLIADVMLFVPAVALAHRRMLRLLGVVHLVVAAVLLACLAVFALDWLQLRGNLRQSVSRGFDTAAIRAAGMVVIAIGVAVWAGVSALRATRVKGRAVRPEAPLITARPRDETTS